MGTNGADPGVGGCECTGPLTILQIHGPNRPTIPFIKLGTNSPDGIYPWGIPPQGGLFYDRTTDMETS